MQLKSIKQKTLVFVISICALNACGGNSNPRNHEKQRSPADIKINSLDFETGDVSLRLSYRSHIVNSLENISCDIRLDQGKKINIEQQPHIDLDAFSIEILDFNQPKLKDKIETTQNNSINYSINCDLKYDKGYETVNEKSVIYLVPGSKYQFR